MGMFSTCTKCRTLIPLGESRCANHKPAPRKAKTSTRGYGTEHQQLRAWYQRRMNEGTTYRCARCKTLIKQGQAWDLGHDDHDRTRYTGPEHATCNRGRRKRPTPT